MLTANNFRWLVAVALMVLSFLAIQPLISPTQAKAKPATVTAKASPSCKHIGDAYARLVCMTKHGGGGIHLPSPVKIVSKVVGAVGGVVTGVTSDIVGKIIDGLNQTIASGVTWIIKVVNSYIFSSTLPQVQAAWFISQYWMVINVAAYLGVAALIVGLVRALWSEDPFDIVVVLMWGVIVFLAVVALPGIVWSVVKINAGLTSWWNDQFGHIVSVGLTNLTNNLDKGPIGIASAGQVAPFVLLLILFIAVLGALFDLLILLLAEVSLYYMVIGTGVMLLLAPASEDPKAFLAKPLRVMAALVTVPLVMAVLLTVSFGIMSAAKSLFPSLVGTVSFLGVGLGTAVYYRFAADHQWIEVVKGLHQFH